MNNLNGSPLVALTTYYNPLRYERRRVNYQQFWRSLNVPLITVELVYDNRPELRKEDADLLIQIHGGSIMWQKERLLNIGFSHVPTHVPFVAWLDCDVIFSQTNWSQIACNNLEQMPLTQLFSQVYDLPPSAEPLERALSEMAPSGSSIAHLVAKDGCSDEDFRPRSGKSVRRAAFGLAWAARRELISQHGFYDAMVLGSGDRALACAAIGRFEDAIAMAQMSSIRANHYLKWALPFNRDVGGLVGCVDGALFHLWHGDLENRRYVERHIDFANFDFDPDSDLVLSNEGCWTWGNGPSALSKFVENYFAHRNEDGLR